MYKVFLVEDEIVVREGIRNNILWEQYGFSYAGDAPDGELALPMIRKIKPDLLITDIKMPFMDGLALSEIVRRELPRTKIVIISGYDDFSYAQQAIQTGVEQYLLKPVVKEKMVETLKELEKQMKTEQQQLEHLEVFEREAKEYETFSRRRFFEQIVTGGLSASQISKTAAEMDIDINAQCYNIVLISLNSESYNGSSPESYTDTFVSVQDSVTQFLDNQPELLLFRWNVTTYAVLIKGRQENIDKIAGECIESVKSFCAAAGRDVNWYIAAGTPVSRLSSIPLCFAEASRILTYRYLCPQEHILTEASINDMKKRSAHISDSDKSEICQAHIRSFLSSGSREEIGHFMDRLLEGTADETVSTALFCRYLSMTVYFAATQYLDSIGCNADIFWPQKLRPKDETSKPEDVRRYVCEVMGHVIDLRDRESRKQQSDMLINAVGFIDKNFSKESISLDMVARKVNISPNYFSALFSQEVGQTFVEYLTGKRIGEAKRLLHKTEKRSGEIAFAVGYKDPHYFSFVFKKVTGFTPSEYRRGEKK